MGKSKRGNSGSASGTPAPQKDKSEEASVITMRMDGTSESPLELDGQSQRAGGPMMPCTLTGVGAGLSGGSLGFVFGFGGYWLKNFRGGKFKASLAEGWGSAKTFAIMGGLYAAVSCFMVRLRHKNDAWNGAASGCATGLALGFKQGPLSALQSCAMLGAFSYFVDGMAGSEAEAASTTGPGAKHGAGSSTDSSSSSSNGGSRQRSPIELLLSPAVPLLAAFSPCSFGGSEGCGGGGGGGGVLGCRVRR